MLGRENRKRYNGRGLPRSCHAPWGSKKLPKYWQNACSKYLNYMPEEGVWCARQQGRTLKDGIGTEGLVRLKVAGSKQQAVVLQALHIHSTLLYFRVRFANALRALQDLVLSNSVFASS